MSAPPSSAPGPARPGSAVGAAGSGPAAAGSAAGSVAAVAAERPRARRPDGTSVRAAAVLLAVTCVWVVWRTGPGKVPGIESHELIARGWPTIPMTPDTAYVLRVPLGQILYGLLPREGTGTFLALHLACLLGTAALLALWLCRRLGTAAGLVAATVVALSPITAVLLHWIGMYDAFSVLTWVLLLMTLRRGGPWQAAAAFVAGVQNFEQVLVGLLMLLLVPRLSRAAGVRPRAAWLLAGAVAGKIALEAFLRSVEATSGSRLTFLANWETFSHLIGTSLANGPIIVWSALAGLWGFALSALLRGWDDWSRRERLQLGLAVLLWAGASTITADHTRVLALTSFPLVVLGAIALADRHRDLSRLAVRPEAWMLFLAPAVVVFDYIELPMGIQPGLWGVWVF